MQPLDNCSRCCRVLGEIVADCPVRGLRNNRERIAHGKTGSSQGTRQVLPTLRGDPVTAGIGKYNSNRSTDRQMP
jgi:hypothetical protein